MRRKLIAGNWKMNTGLEEAKALASGLVKEAGNNDNVDMLVCPPFTNIHAVNEIIKDSNIKLGAQDIYWEEKGAFTGEISADMLKSVGCSYVIIGHSERRRFFNETDETVNKKIKTAISSGLKAIVCVGESLEQRNDGKQMDVVEKQLQKALKGVSKEDANNLIIAYEPLWAISGGDPSHKAATPEDGQEMHKFIRGTISRIIGEDTAKNIIILYGGSAKPSNAKEILSMPDIDGALVGGASLVAKDFASIINSC
jgi:triosephosphate isomerase (TIM)